MVPVAAVIALAAGLFTAVPAQAAISLPAGCKALEISGVQEVKPASAAEVAYLDCGTVRTGADFSQYTNLNRLDIGNDNPGYRSKVALTKLPKLPASLNRISINAPKMADYSALSNARNLEFLYVSYPTKGLKLASLPTWNPKLKTVLIGDYTTGVDASPLAKLKHLEELMLVGTIPSLYVNQYAWVPGGFPKALNGKAILPPNGRWYDRNGKDSKKNVFDYDAKTSKLRINGDGYQPFSSDYRSTKPTATQPRLKEVRIEFDRDSYVAGVSDWAKDKNAKLQLSGNSVVGGTVTARLSNSKSYIDAYQWYRSGVAIKDATKRSYKLTRADLGKKISVRATDNKNQGYGDYKRSIPYSVSLTATHKAQYGFTMRKPSISGTPRAGKKLSAKFTKWGGSPSKYSYQWYRNGKAIKGATKATYKVATADKGRKLTVKVTGSKKDFRTTSSTSAARNVSR